MSPHSEERRIVLHHVGSRGTGWRLLPAARPFAKEIVNVFYDADADCVAQTQEWWDTNTECSTSVRECCVLDKDGEADFHLNYDPCTSSVFLFNDRFARYSLASRSTDYLLGEGFRTVETRRISTRSLDSLVTSGEVPPPDVLSLDTQGSEFEILTGGRHTIGSQTVAVATEVTMSDLYSGQKTFGDIHGLLTELGFELAEFNQTGAFARFRGPLGARGRRELLQADTVYLRRPETVHGESRTSVLCKLAFVAAMLGHVEYALAALEDARASRDTAVESGLGTFRYVAFLRDLEAAAARLHEYLPTFQERHTLEQSAESSERGVAEPPAGRTRKRPWLVRFARARARSMLLRSLQWRVRRHAGLAGPSPLESVFADYGVGSVADLLREQRQQTYEVTGSPSELLRSLRRGVY